MNDPLKNHPLLGHNLATATPSNTLLQIKRLPFPCPSSNQENLTHSPPNRSFSTHPCTYFHPTLTPFVSSRPLGIPLNTKHIFKFPPLTSLRSSLHLSHSLKAKLSPNLPSLQNIITYLRSADFYPAYLTPTHSVELIGPELLTAC